MDCGEEVATLRRSLAGLVPGDSLRFDIVDGTMTVPTDSDVPAILAAIAQTGMSATPMTGAANEESWWLRRRLMLIVVVSGMATILGFLLHATLQGFTAAVGSEGMGIAHSVPLPAKVAYGLAVVMGLVLVFPKALRAVRSMRPDMNLLMTLAVIGAIGIDEWFEAATVSFLFALSLALEAWSVGRARRAVERLMALTPPRVTVVRDGHPVEVDANEVKVGTTFMVRPGERFGLDGVVLNGRSEVNQAPITGESVPVEKRAGDEVFAGTINGNGAIEARSSAMAHDTTLARIVEMVADARQDRSNAERWVERFAAIYTPLVLATALAVLITPPLLFGASWSEWFYRALVLLVIGCPCALVISTPVAVVAGLAAAARHGVLVKGGRFLEIPAKLRVVALDKTGTLTKGKLSIVAVTPLDDHSAEALIARAAAIEQHSHHPIARAILTYARTQKLDIPAALAVENVPGKGTTGDVDGQRYWLGSHRWLEERAQESPAVHQLLEKETGAGRSVVVVGTDHHVCGLLSLADEVRGDTATSISALARAGIERVVMLTGDNAGTARVVGDTVGISDVRAELLPADKLAAVESLEREVGPVAMIGDGVNDAPALARATLGIAMGALGTDIAIETADVTLMNDDLTKLAWLVEHSRRTLTVIRQNTAFALAVKAVFVGLTFVGVASLWTAIVADMGASLLVVLNAMRLLRS